MIDSFSIKEEKFVEETYYVILGYLLIKKKYLDIWKKNVFPSIPLSQKFLFIPIIIDEKNNELLIFENNKIYDEWNSFLENHHLIEYILLTEDLEDINIIQKNYDLIEKYDFREIINKYYLENSIISLIFKNDKGGEGIL